MKGCISCFCALFVSATAFGQDSAGEDTSGGAAETNSSYLLNNYMFEDAGSLDAGGLDFRFGTQWRTGSHPGGSSDNFILTPTIVWGISDELELTFGVDAWVGDGNDMGPFDDGNFDSNLGLQWRFFDQVGFERKEGYLHLPSMAVAATARIPTGCESNGLDVELRFIASYEYSSGIRSHINVFGKWLNGDNHETRWDNDDEIFGWDDSDDGFSFLGLNDDDDDDLRDFQCGAVIGADGPISSDGSLRWIADYTFTGSNYDGNSSNHIGEIGLEWEMSAASRLGLSVQAALDHAGDAPNWGMGIMYALSLGS